MLKENNDNCFARHIKKKLDFLFTTFFKEFYIFMLVPN